MAPKYSDVYNQADASLERQTKSYERLDAAIRTAETRVRVEAVYRICRASTRLLIQ